MSNRKEIIREKLQAKELLIKLKKSGVKHTNGLIALPTAIKEATNKGQLPDDTDEVIYRTIIANTYNWMDSHEDVHLNGCFKKSIAENKLQLYLKDHIQSVDKIAGKVLKAYEMEGMFKDFGFNSTKATQALLKDVAIYRNEDEKFFNQIKNGQINQHSVGMRYIKISLAVDDVTAEEEYKLYTSLLPNIGNYKAVEEQGYFFAVHEAQELETSAVTLGSNSLTGVYDDNKSEIDKLIAKFGDLTKINELCENALKQEAEQITSLQEKSLNRRKIIF